VATASQIVFFRGADSIQLKSGFGIGHTGDDFKKVTPTTCIKFSSGPRKTNYYIELVKDDKKSLKTFGAHIKGARHPLYAFLAHFFY
jgi:hypothetical protein